MSTSGTYNFTLNKAQIITRALQLINVVDINGAIEADDYSYGSDALNMMLKTWEAEGIHLWKRRIATLFTVLNQYNYQLGSVSGADRAVNTYVSTTVSSAVASSATAVTVASTSGLSTGMNIGLEQDDNTRIWGTISSIVGSVVNVSFTTTTTAAVGNTVVAYAASGALINRPLKVMRATLLDLKSSTQTEVTMQALNYDDYYNLPVKSTSGRPNNFFYDHVLNNSLPFTGQLNIFPAPNATSTVIQFTYYDSIQDMLNNADNADLPQEWLQTIVWNLATDLATAYGKMTELQQLAPRAQQMKMMLEKFDSDDEGLMIRPDLTPFNPRT